MADEDCPPKKRDLSCLLSKKRPKKQKVKKSYGISCFRINNKVPELLLVRKRNSYNFIAFVFGNYSIHDDIRLKELFNGMTAQEKIDILSMRFDLLWYKICLVVPEQYMPKYDLSSVESITKTHTVLKKSKSGFNNAQLYIRKKSQFDQTFTTQSGRERLLQLINNTTNIELLWEIPKGRKNTGETDIECSIREFSEETGISLGNYSIIFDTPPTSEVFQHANTKYIHTYYTAYMNEMNDDLNTFQVDNINREVSYMGWYSLRQIKIFGEHRLTKLAKTLFSEFGKRL